MAVGEAKLGDKGNYGKSPIVPIDTFFKQFQLDLYKYHDNNNFIHQNHVKTKDSRINIFEKFRHFDFLSYSMGPTWIGKALNSTVAMEKKDEFTDEIIRYDENSQIILGLYFFLHPNNSQFIRQADNIENLISYLGGLIEILLVSFIGLTTIYNQ